MTTIEIKVPDIGGYDDVPVIEVLVAVGDKVAKDQGLVTLESDKATMEVPSTRGRRGQGAQGQGRRQAVRRQRGGGHRSRRRSVGMQHSSASSACGGGRRAQRDGWGRSCIRTPIPTFPRKRGKGREHSADRAFAGQAAGTTCAPGRGRERQIRRHRLPHRRARLRPRRLHRRLPRRRPRPGHGAGRTLRHARRRLPQRRLHPVEGAAACRGA